MKVMDWAIRLCTRLAALFCGQENLRRLNDEIQFHLEQQIAENVAAGMSREQARLAALRLFGNPQVVKEKTQDTWGWQRLEQVARDVRNGVRSLWRTPRFALLGIFVMA